MKGLPLLLTAMAFAISLPLAKADPFIGGSDNSSKIHSNLSDFGRSLDDAGRNMRSDYDYHNSMDAQQQRAFSDSVQADTGAMSQHMFQASQMQAATSGGLYNGNGSNNMGGFAIVPVLPGYNPLGPYNVAPLGSQPTTGYSPAGPITNPYYSNTSAPGFNSGYQQASGFNWGIGSLNGGTANTTQSSLSK